MISIAAAELGYAGGRALASLRDGDLDAYDRWSEIAGQLVDVVAARADGRPVPIPGRTCTTCGAEQARAIHVPRDTCALCRAAAGLWWAS